MGKRKSNKSQGSATGGCLTILLGMFVLSIALIIYSFAWIPAIAFLIYIIVKKDTVNNFKLKTGISVAVIITSLLAFGIINSEEVLESINVTWDETTFDINDSVDLKISFEPTEAEITSLTISDNSIATLNYQNGIATLSFTTLGTEEIYIIANESIQSEKVNITVIDKNAEVEDIITPTPTDKPTPEVTPEPTEEPTPEPTEKPTPAPTEEVTPEPTPTEEPKSTYILNTNTNKFHETSCGEVKKIKPKNYEKYTGTREDVINQGYKPCGRCKP